MTDDAHLNARLDEAEQVCIDVRVAAAAVTWARHIDDKELFDLAAERFEAALDRLEPLTTAVTNTVVARETASLGDELASFLDREGD